MVQTKAVALFVKLKAEEFKVRSTAFGRVLLEAVESLEKGRKGMRGRRFAKLVQPTKVTASLGKTLLATN